MARLFIKEFRTGDQVAQTFLVKSKRRAVSKTNKPFLDIDLTDKTGQINAKVWDRADEINEMFARGDVVMVRGSVEEFMNKPQLKILDLRPVTKSEIDYEPLVKTGPYDPTKLWAGLMEIIGTVKEPHLKALMDEFFNDKEFALSFRHSAAARNIHHCYQGGLLEHSLNVVRITVHACETIFSGRVDRDLAVCGAVLHDVGKVRELDSKAEISYTTEGYLVGHVALGSIIVRERAARIKDFPPELLMLLDHIMLSHHGEKEFGAPIVPMTPEAMIVSYADNLDAKTQVAVASIEEDPNSDEEFTQYHRTLARHFFKGVRREDKDKGK